MSVDLDALVWLALIGVPVVTWLGWRLAPGTADAGLMSAIGRAVSFAIQAVVTGSFTVTALGLLGEPDASVLDWRALVLLPYLVAIPVVGIVLFGLPALGVTLPAAFLWTGILRALVARLRPPVEPVSP